MKISKLILLLAVSLFLFGCKQNPDKIVLKQQVIIEYGQEVKASGLIISGKYDTASIENLDIKKIGKQEINIILETKGKKKNYKMQVEITDTISPIFQKQTDIITLQQGDSFDINQYFKAVDPVDGDITVTLDETVDTSVPGKYSVFILAKDINGNVSKVKSVIHINAIAEHPTNGTNSNSNSNNSRSGNDTGNNYNPPTPNVNPGSLYKQFLFSSGYDMNSSYSACLNYLNSTSAAYGVGGSCMPLKNGGTYTGYEAIFN